MNSSIIKNQNNIEIEKYLKRFKLIELKINSFEKITPVLKLINVSDISNLANQPVFTKDSLGKKNLEVLASINPAVDLSFKIIDFGLNSFQKIEDREKQRIDIICNSLNDLRLASLKTTKK